MKACTELYFNHTNILFKAGREELFPWILIKALKYNIKSFPLLHLYKIYKQLVSLSGDYINVL